MDIDQLNIIKATIHLEKFNIDTRLLIGKIRPESSFSLLFRRDLRNLFDFVFSLNRFCGRKIFIFISFNFLNRIFR